MVGSGSFSISLSAVPSRVGVLGLANRYFIVFFVDFENHVFWYYCSSEFIIYGCCKWHVG